MSHFLAATQHTHLLFRKRCRACSVAAVRGTSMSKHLTNAHTNILVTLVPAAPLNLLTDYEKLQSITPDPILPLCLANLAKSPHGARAPDKHRQISLRWLWTGYFHMSLF